MCFIWASLKCYRQPNGLPVALCVTNSLCFVDHDPVRGWAVYAMCIECVFY